MKRPSFQFYPADWQGNSNLRRCTHAEKGIWLDVMCLMHDSEEYGTLRWSLKEIAQAVGCKLFEVKALITKGVLKGCDSGACEPFVYTPRSGRKDGDPVTLVGTQDGPIWYSSRMVRDEYVRTIRGESTRFSADKDESPKQAPKTSPKPTIGDGSTSSSSSSVNHSDTSLRSVSATDGGGASAKSPEQMTKDELWSAGKSLLEQQGMPRAQCGSFVGKLVKDHGANAVVEAVRSAVVERPADAVSFLKAACVSRTSRSAKPSIHDIPAREVFAGPVAVDGAGRPIEIPDTQSMEGVI